MPELKHKLEVFSETVLTESEKEVRQITDDLKLKSDAALIDAKKEAKAEAERFRAAKTAEITAREHKRVSTNRAQCRHDHLIFREQCADDIRQELIRRIADYTKTEDYALSLRSFLKKALAYVGTTDSCRVFLRTEDMHLAEALAKEGDSNNISFLEGRFVLGGLRLICDAKKQRVDMSFDSAVSDLMRDISEISGIKEVS